MALLGLEFFWRHFEHLVPARACAVLWTVDLPLSVPFWDYTLFSVPASEPFDFLYYLSVSLSMQYWIQDGGRIRNEAIMRKAARSGVRVSLMNFSKD